MTAAVDGAPRAADTSELDGVEQALAAALHAAADDVLGRANYTRRRLGWQAEHADTLKEMAAARRQLAARHDLSATERKEARRRQCSEQRRELRRLVASWWDKRLDALHSGRGMPSKGAVEAAEREAGLSAKAKGRVTELLARDGTPLCGHDAQLGRWREHFAGLFAEGICADLGYIADAVPRRPPLMESDAMFTRAEYAGAVQALKVGKTADEDGIVTELLRAAGDAIHDTFCDLVRACWKHGQVPTAWRDAIMVPLPKGKGDARLCDSWRGISLLSVPGKILARLVATCITRNAEGVLVESANGFRPGRGTMDCVAIACQLIDMANSSDSGLCVR